MLLTFAHCLSMSRNEDEIYMQRCLSLALCGRGAVAPNPLVGAVLACAGKIISEGYHRRYGGPHAEAVCLAALPPRYRHLLPASTLYVSLEPCAHFGKTPPCADLLVREGIKEVVVGCRDPFPAVDGKGIEKLLAAGITVRTGIEEAACRHLNRRFFTFHQQHRPYVVLKWAQTANGKIAAGGSERLLISNDMTNRIVHRWRATEMAIMVGTNTALADDPQLNLRHWPGRQPLRVVLDLDLKLPQTLRLFTDGGPTLVFNKWKHTLEPGTVPAGLSYYGVGSDADLIHQVLNGLRFAGVQSLLVEGGARLLQSFIDAGSWDEARVITNTKLQVPAGLQAPEWNVLPARTEMVQDDIIHYYQNIH